MPLIVLNLRCIEFSEFPAYLEFVHLFMSTYCFFRLLGTVKAPISLYFINFFFLWAAYCAITKVAISSKPVITGITVVNNNIVRIYQAEAAHPLLASLTPEGGRRRHAGRAGAIFFNVDNVALERCQKTQQAGSGELPKKWRQQQANART